MNSQSEKIFLEREDSQHSVPYSEADSGAGSECSEDHEDVDTERKLIKPDMMAISKLLNFDEVQIVMGGVKCAVSIDFQEEEDDLTDSETEESDYKSAKSNVKWQKAIVKDLASLTTGDPVLERRHSISKCESATLKPSASEKQDCFPFSSLTAVSGVPSLGTHNSTLNLSLSEVGHIRSVLVRAELEV